MTEPSAHGHHPVTSHAELRAQAVELLLHGLLAHWDELMGQPETEQRVRQWLGWESVERAHRSLERRLREAHLGHFKPLADFDWSWPKKCDRTAIEELMSLQFLADASSVVLFGPNRVGKSMIAANLAHQAVLQGHTALFTTAGQMLSELAALDSDSALRRRLQHYAAPDLLLIDEVGYLSYSNRHADMLFELVAGGTFTRTRSSLRIADLPTGARSSPTPLAWSRSSTARCTAPRSCASRATRTARRKGIKPLSRGRRR